MILMKKYTKWKIDNILQLKLQILSIFIFLRLGKEMQYAIRNSKIINI